MKAQKTTYFYLTGYEDFTQKISPQVGVYDITSDVSGKCPQNNVEMFKDKLLGL